MNQLPLGPRLDRPISGEPLDGRSLNGRTVSMERLDIATHGATLYRSFCDAPAQEAVWTYMSFGPWPDEAAFLDWLETVAGVADPMFYVIIPISPAASAGMAAFMNHAVQNGSIELGSIWYAPSLQQRAAGTEAIHLMLCHAFDDLGCRRVEWKCNSLNAKSRRAAERFGFVYEGHFRQHYVVKGRNRDTSWYAMIDQDWPAAKARFQSWLAPENFDKDDRQRVAFEAIEAA